MSKAQDLAVRSNQEAALQAVAQWASDRGALKGKGPMEVSDFARRMLKADGKVDWPEVRVGASELMLKDAEAFAEFAADAREDFHEPDEQDISYRRVEGRKLDNAGFRELEGKPYECHLVLRKGKEDFVMNLADVLALAKYGSKVLLERYGNG
jgi:hypothetical protein